MNKMNNLNDHWLKGIILLKSSQNLTQFIEIRENAVFYGYWRCSFISNKDIGCVAVTIFLQFNNLFIPILLQKSLRTKLFSLIIYLLPILLQKNLRT